MPKVNTHVPAVWKDLITDTGTTKLYTLGQYREEDGNGYRYGKVNDATVSVVAGNLVYSVAPGTALWEVASDVSDSDANLVVGVAISSVANGSYGWFQTKGYYATVNTNGDDDISLGDAIVPSAAGDGTCDSTAAGTAPVRRVVGFAAAADVVAANTVAVLLTLE